MTDERSSVNKLVVEHIAFAKRLAVQFHRKRVNLGFDLEDIEGAAMLGLCDAARRFDPERDMLFKTFAYFRVKGAMFDLLRDGGIQRRQFNRLVKNQDSEEDAERSAIESSDSESSEHIPYAFAKTLLELVGLMRTIDDVGIHVYVGLGGEAEISYASALDPEELTVVRSVRRYLRQLIRQLPERQQEVLEMRYFEEQSFEQISQQLGGLSKSWISRMHTTALDTLKDLMIADQKLCRLQQDGVSTPKLHAAAVGATGA